MLVGSFYFVTDVDPELSWYGSFSYEGRWKQKLQTSVDFPQESLDLAQYVIGPKQNLKRYNLFGVSVSTPKPSSSLDS